MDKSKATDLINKCMELAEKIVEEKSRIKRTLYSIKIKMIIAKIEKELDIRDLQEKYSIEREDREEELYEEKTDARTESIKISRQIKALKKELNANREYDYSSESFLFPKEEVEAEGGIDRYIGILRTSGSVEQEEVADDIQQTLAKRRKLEELEKNLQDRKMQLKNADRKAKWDNRKSKVTETALVTAKKANFFSKIATFFKSIRDNFKDNKNELTEVMDIEKRRREELKSSKVENKNSVKIHKEEFEQAKREIYQEYQEKMQKLQEEYKQIVELQKNISNIDKEIINQTYSNTKETSKHVHRTEKSNKFKEEIRELAQRFSDTDDILNEREEQSRDDETIHMSGEVVDKEGNEIDD